MKSRFGDAQMYEFHSRDESGKCFLCACESSQMFVVRELKSMQMVHLCKDCMVNNASDYLLDNTRPWEEK